MNTNIAESTILAMSKHSYVAQAEWWIKNCFNVFESYAAKISLKEPFKKLLIQLRLKRKSELNYVNST